MLPHNHVLLYKLSRPNFGKCRIRIHAYNTSTLREQCPPTFAQYSRLIRASLSLNFRIASERRLQQNHQRLIDVAPIRTAQANICAEHFRNHFRTGRHDRRNTARPGSLKHGEQRVDRMLTLFFGK